MNGAFKLPYGIRRRLQRIRHKLDSGNNSRRFRFHLSQGFHRLRNIYLDSIKKIVQLVLKVALSDCARGPIQSIGYGTGQRRKGLFIANADQKIAPRRL